MVVAVVLTPTYVAGGGGVQVEDLGHRRTREK